MKNAYTKDILRTIRTSAKRFLAILAITALGLTAFSGITAAVNDMYRAADRFYDDQRLFDIRIQSTLGLTDDDVEALRNVNGVAVADGGYSETVHTQVNDQRHSADMRMLGSAVLNAPHLLDGAMPQRAGEIAVTQAYLNESGRVIGDTLTIEEDLDEPDDEPAEDDTPPDDPVDVDDADDDGLDIDIEWDADVDIEDERETPTFLRTQYTIVGVVLDPLDIANSEGTAAFRSTATTDYTFFVTPGDVDTDVYTSVDLLLHGLAELDCYSGEYQDAVQAVVARIEETIMTQRQQARYDAVIAQALETITDAEAIMNDNFDKADELFADAWADIEEARRELEDGVEELTREERNAKRELREARRELEDGKRELEDAQAELADARIKLEDGQKEYDEGLLEYYDGLAEYRDERANIESLAGGVSALPGMRDNMQTLLGAYVATGTDGPTILSQFTQTADNIALTLDNVSRFFVKAKQPELAAGIDQLAQAVSGSADAAQRTGSPADMAVAYYTVSALFAPPDTALYPIIAGAMSAAIDELDAAHIALEEAWDELVEGRLELEDGWDQYYDGLAQLREGRLELEDGERELNAEEAKALREIADAWEDIADGRRELTDGEQKLLDYEADYQTQRADAQRKLADAYAELDDIDMTQWYVQDRASIDSYSGLDSDLGSIGAIGRVFPILFLVVAVLISLTTMTRMVEEERGLIGTYKALGFSDFTIGRKYVVYALLASLAGSLLGHLFGFVVLPQLLIAILGAIYTLPTVPLYFDIPYALFGTGLFMLSISLATAWTCRKSLRRMPAALLRPKSPRAGARIFLERITPVWNRLRFLDKVTARNLFRYKKRLLMTVIGIAGCTALVLTGFAIRDSVTDLIPRQYEHIYRYDWMVVANDNDDDRDALVAHLASDTAIADHLLMRLESIKALNAAGDSEGMQLIVVPDGASLAPYVHTPGLDGALLAPDDDGVLITQNAADLLGLAPGDIATLQTLALDRYDVKIGAVVENYLGNSVYMTRALYESLLGDYECNAAYAHFTDSVVDHANYAQRMLDEDFVVSSVSVEALKSQFTTDFAVLNYVIYILLVLAAGLAFVVLFTLSNTNISERVRELATIKVLGFFDREVHAYVNKETLILTAIGIAGGLPLGYAVSKLLLAALKMPSLVFALVIEPPSYAIAAAIAFCFALLVDLITNRVLDRINMVEALKSVE